MNSRNNIRGSLWSQWDLHFHTPSSYDYHDKNVTDDQIIKTLIEEEISVIAITDHHVIDVERIERLQKLSQNKITILPGIELRDDHGGKPIHYICLFPEDCDLHHVWTTLQGGLKLTRVSIDKMGGDDKIYVPIEQAFEKVSELGGIISIHAGEKSNSIEGISNSEQFQQRIKFDITKKYVSLMEIGQIKDVQVHKSIIFPATGLERPLVIGSDNHNIKNYSRKSATWLRADPTFNGLRMVLNEPADRVFIGDYPSDLIRVNSNPTKIINKLTYERKTTLPTDQKWFSGEIHLNPGLVAIIGNKGSGKSALADTLGLLASSKNYHSFSFLNPDRFCHPQRGFAQHFQACLTFNSGESFAKSLNEVTKADEIERVKYLPQDHIETICNELAEFGESSFEKELKSVIFSHVPAEKRLGQNTLDKLISFSASEKNRRIDSLRKSLIGLARSLAELEEQLDPSVEGSIREKIKRKETEIKAHSKLKPEVIEDPSISGVVAKEIENVLKHIKQEEEKKKEIVDKIRIKLNELRDNEKTLAIANRVSERISNFDKEWKSFKIGIDEDVKILGLNLDELIQVSFNLNPLQAIIDARSKINDGLHLELNSIDPPGLYKQKEDLELRIEKFNIQLDAPNRKYQKYLSDLQIWATQLASLEGDDNNPDSLKGLKAILDDIKKIPEKIVDLKNEMLNIAEEIHKEKKSLADLYRTLYGPVQSFIDSHKIAKDKLKLEFKAELLNDGFVEMFLPLIAQNRKGSFMGLEEGKERVEKIILTTNMEDWESVKNFIKSLDENLHFDRREEQALPVLLKDQLVKGKKIEDIYNLLFGLDYIVPRYVLKWDNKDLSMLSPGERGTLLLVFYLLIDKGDDPLIIDQPEGNLDNHTVAKVLIDCIKEARKRRQIIIVTHNPNLAVVCDADQVIYSTLNIENGNEIVYRTGALENPEMNLSATDVLEGTRYAFNVRGLKYEISN